ncbi:Uncharacterised protein [Mycobacteroides abscessus subsp. abscessus]|nr:Uncharacterised protein [Mycobacteroides abscessus subsp. abscessus]
MPQPLKHLIPLYKFNFINFIIFRIQIRPIPHILNYNPIFSRS